MFIIMGISYFVDDALKKYVKWDELIGNVCNIKKFGVTIWNKNWFVFCSNVLHHTDKYDNRNEKK